MIKPIENKKSQFWIFFGVLLFLSVFMTWIYGAVYEHPGYDYYFHLTRFDALITALREGTFPIYSDYTAALGYGYIHKFFYSDIILIPFAFIGIFTGAQPAYEIMSFVMTLLCGMFMYQAVNTIYKNRYAAFLGAILYTFSLYRLFDIYQRGALGEVFAFTFIPIVFLGLYHIIKGDYKRWYIIAIGFSLLIFSHVISTVLASFTALVLLVVNYKSLIKEPKRFYYLILAAIVTVAITSSYIFPLLEQLTSNSFRYEGDDWSLPSRTKLNPVYLLWSLLCGFVFPKDIMIVGIGIILTLLVFFRFFVKERSSELRSVDIGVFIGLFYIFVSSAFFPWGRFPFTLLSFIQYPSRLFLFVTYFFAIAGAYYLSKIFLKEKQKIVVAVAVVLCIMFTMYMHSDNNKYMHQTYISESNNVPSPRNFFYLNGAEYVPSRVESAYYVQSRGDSVISSFDKVSVNNFHREKGVLNLSIVTQSPDSLELPLFYYKGYSARLGGEELPVVQSKHGLIQVPVERSGDIKVFYAGTTIQKIAWYATIISIISLCIYIFVSRRKRFPKKEEK